MIRLKKWQKGSANSKTHKMLNFKLPTPDELREFQIEHYTSLMNNAKTFDQKIFLRKQIKQLNGKDESNDRNRIIFRYRGNNILCERATQVQEGIERRF